MKQLHLVVAASALLALATVPVRAQDTSTSTSTSTQTTTTAPARKAKASGSHKNAGRAQGELDELSRTLNLTDDQKAKIKPILEDKDAQIHAARMDKTGTADQTKAKTKAIREDANTKIRALLTPDQQKQFAGVEHKHKKDAAPTT